MTIKISGIPAIQKKFDALPSRMQKKLLRSAMTKAGRIVAAEAKARVPVKTGALRKSIKVAGLKGGRGAGLTARGGGKAAPIGKRVVAAMPYAQIIERGRKGAKAQPYLRPALDAKELQVRDLIKDDVARAVQEMKA